MAENDKRPGHWDFSEGGGVYRPPEPEDPAELARLQLARSFLTIVEGMGREAGRRGYAPRVQEGQDGMELEWFCGCVYGGGFSAVYKDVYSARTGVRWPLRKGIFERAVNNLINREILKAPERLLYTTVAWEDVTSIGGEPRPVLITVYGNTRHGASTEVVFHAVYNPLKTMGVREYSGPNHEEFPALRRAAGRVLGAMTCEIRRLSRAAA